jgi:PIN domain nuclease of toxin-antitoxin system
VKLLLDSHALLWALAAPEKLRAEARDAIRDPGNIVFFSPASIWELEIKVARGRLQLPEDWINSIGASGFLELVIHLHHAQAAARLPWLHSDPFDRMLIAQAKLEELHLVSRDQFVKDYGVPIMKA